MTKSDTPGELDPKALLPCPFCGSKEKPGVEKFEGTGPGFYIVCSASGFDGDPNKGCGGSSGWGETPDEARADWNRRSPSVIGSDTAGLPSDCAGLVKRLSEVAGKLDTEGYDDCADDVREAIAALSRIQEATPVAWLVQGEDTRGNPVWSAVTKDPTRLYGPNMPIIPLAPIAALSRAPEAVAWRWRYSNKGPWQYTENPPSSGLYDGCEYEPLHTTHPAPQPALALIEELERALGVSRTWVAAKQNRNKQNAARCLTMIDTALASAKRFKEGE